jgi:DNA invertase Pin-like site-specific DNA recombinase
LRLADSGNIEAGSYLLVENLDRLSRATAIVALPIFIEILNRGITVVTLADGFVYSRDSVTDNPMQLLFSLMIMTRANEESAIKSKRIRSSWAEKQKNIDNKRITERCPYWLKPSVGLKGFEFIPDRVEVVKSIVKMAREGMGNTTIVQRLNDKKVETFSATTDGWRPSYIQKMLKGPAIYGDYTASGKLSDPVVGYFPAVISKEEWLLVDSIRKARITKGGANKGNQLSNLFSGLLFCGHCHGPMNMGGHVKKKSSGTKVRKYVACSRARRGMGCKFIAWEYGDLENEIIRFCKSVDFGSILGQTSALSDQAADAIKTSLALNDQIVANNQKLAKLVYSIESEEEVPKVILARIKTIEKEIADLQEQYEIATFNAQQWSTAAIEQSHQQEAIIEILDKLQTLQGTELHDLRISLSTRIKRVVEKISLYPAGSWMTKDNLAAVKAEMTNDGVLDEAGIDNYLMPFSEVNKEERYLIISFKNGESLELAKNHATPFKGADIEWYGKRPVFWPLSREKYLTSP